MVDKRDNDDDSSTRRRRECVECFKRFTTYERIENVDLDVVKKDGTVEPFNREKLRKSIRKAMKKEAITEDQICGLIEDIEMKLLNRKDTTVKSSDIGGMTLTRLKKIDPVTYMRFASVYKNFDSLDDFENELKVLQDSK